MVIQDHRFWYQSKAYVLMIITSDYYKWLILIININTSY